MKLRKAITKSALFATLVAFFAIGCAPAAEEVDADEGAYKVPTEARVGETREIQISDFPARSRDAAERAAGKPDAVVATWHVHLVTLAGNGGRWVLVYGADMDGDVRSAFVIDAEDPPTSGDAPAHAVFYVEPEKDAVAEDLSALTRKAQASVSPERLRWFSEEFARLKEASEKNADAAEAASTNVRPRDLNRILKCSARITTMVLATVGGAFLGGPVGGFVASAVEAAVWGDFEGAAVTGSLAGGLAATEAMKRSAKPLISHAGSVLKGLGVVGVVGLVGVALYLDPKTVVKGLVPPQCKSPG